MKSTLPNYPDLITLDPNVIHIIEQACIEAKHLSQNNHIIDIIETNLNILTTHNLDKNDIYKNHRNMYLNLIILTNTMHIQINEMQQIMSTL